jgi:hypothetical protein
MSSRREFVRVQAAIELEYEVIPEMDWGQWTSGSLLVSRRQRDHLQSEADYSLSRTLSGQLDPEVVRFLDHLDKKLNCLMNLLTQREDGAERNARMVAVSLSGCGISFACEDLVLDDHVLVTMYISDNPVSRVEAVGTVVRVSNESDERRIIGISFEQITEADREAIIRYTFQIQRDLAKLNLGCDHGVAVEE